MNETDFIAALRRLPLHPGARNLDDDAAVLEIGGETLIVTHDAMAEGVHFSADADPADIAWKLVASNLSDLAAKGAAPEGVLLSYALGGDDARFLVGLRDVLEAYDVRLLGGDTIGTDGPRTIGLTAIGRATHTPVPSRSGARPGDAIWVCGKLGAAMLGFENPDGEFANAFLRPEPLIDEGRALAPMVSAMMDISDGLLLDASRMARASNVTLNLEAAHLDIAERSRLMECLTWGDDYALLFTCEKKLDPPVIASPAGFVTAPGTDSILLDGASLPSDLKLGYTHG